MVNRVARPGGVFDCWQFGPLRRNKSPVLAPLRAFVNPASEQRDLLFGQFMAGLRRRHHHGWISSADAFEQTALRRFARHDHAWLGKRALLGVEAQARLALLLVWSVALKTVV